MEVETRAGHEKSKRHVYGMLPPALLISPIPYLAANDIDDAVKYRTIKKIFDHVNKHELS